MTQDRSTALLASRLLSLGLPFLYFLTSIAFYLHTYDSAQVKITIVQMLGISLIGIWYVMLLCDRGRDWSQILPITAPLLAALASGILAWTHTSYPGPNLDETLRRVLYVHFGLIALTVINTRERFQLLLKFLLAATAVSTIYGLVQFLDWEFYAGQPAGLDPFVWRIAFASRVFSTFGNPNFYGNFLVILTPITLALITRRHGDKPISILVFAGLTLLVSAAIWHSEDVVNLLHIPSWNSAFVVLMLMAWSMVAAMRFGWLGFLFFMITFSVVVTVSKGAWVGYAGAMLFFLVLLLYFFSQFQSEKVRRTAKQTAVGLIFFAVLAVGVYSGKRVDSIRFRLVTWTSNWEMTQLHPIWGNGIGIFRVLYPAYRRPQIFHIEGKHNTETDHAENEYWEVLMDEGIIGFGIFIWMIYSFSMMGVRALKRFTEGLVVRDPATGKRKVSEDPRAYYMLGVLAAFWGMLTHNFMDVSLRFVSSGIFLWLLAGLIGALVLHDPLPANDAEMEKRLPPIPDAEPHAASFRLPASLAVAALFGWLLVQVVAGFNDAQGPFQGPNGEILLWLIAWGAFAFTVYAVVYGGYRLVRNMKHVYGMALFTVVTLWPLHEFWGYFMADVFHNRGIFFSKQAQWDNAIASYRKVIELNPNYLMAYYFLGNVYTDRWGPGDMDKGMTEYNRLWKLAPNYVQSHHQAGLVHLRAGQDARRQFEELRAQGRLAEAQGAFERAKAMWQKALYYFWKYHLIDPVFEGNYAREAWVRMQLAELAHMENNRDEERYQQDQAERCYVESLQAWQCRRPEHDMMGENWERHHRHYDQAYSAQMWADLGNVRFMRGKLNEAIAAYRMSLKRTPDQVQTMKNLANALARLGRQQEVVAIWNRIRVIAPQDADVQRLFHGAAPAVR